MILRKEVLIAQGQLQRCFDDPAYLHYPTLSQLQRSSTLGLLSQPIRNP